MELNLFSPEIAEDPYPWYRELRAVGQPVKNDLFGFWMVGTHEHATAVLRDPRRFSSAAMASAGPCSTIRLERSSIETWTRLPGVSVCGIRWDCVLWVASRLRRNRSTGPNRG